MTDAERIAALEAEVARLKEENQILAAKVRMYETPKPHVPPGVKRAKARARRMR